MVSAKNPSDHIHNYKSSAFSSFRERIFKKMSIMFLPVLYSQITRCTSLISQHFICLIQTTHRSVKRTRSAVLHRVHNLSDNITFNKPSYHEQRDDIIHGDIF